MWNTTYMRCAILFLLFSKNTMWFLVEGTDLDEMAPLDNIARMTRARDSIHRNIEQQELLEVGGRRNTAKVGDPPVGDPIHNFSPTCEYCGKKGSCGRNRPLDEYFTVDFSDTVLDSIVFGVCAWPDPYAPSCYYAMDGDEPTYEYKDGIHSDEFDEAFKKCPCCNYIYPREWGLNRKPWARLDCELYEGYCPMVEKVCQLKNTRRRSFSCPVGTFMTIQGGFGNTTVAVHDGVIAEYGDNCVANHDAGTVRCTAPPKQSRVLGMYVVVSADDCDCVNCRTGNILVDVCRAPVAHDNFHVGICAKSQDICPKGTGPLRDVADRADEIGNGPAKEQMKIINRIEGRVKTIESAIVFLGGKPSMLEPIEDMKEGIDALKAQLVGGVAVPLP
jgi:hypothetical protein